MVTDLVEIQRLGSARGAENLEFRRYLAAHHHPVEEFQTLAGEVARQIDCTSCANCCRCSTVSVTPDEIAAIARALDAPAEEVTHTYTDPDPGAPALRILKSTRDGCIFLRNNFCTVYRARPKACRDFPHIATGMHSLGARISSLCRWVPLCPIVYNALEDYKRLLGFHTGKH